MNEVNAGTCNAGSEGEMFYDKKVRWYRVCSFNAGDSTYAWRQMGASADQHREDNVTDSVVNNQVIRKGWGFQNATAIPAISESINWGITYDDVPILLVQNAGGLAGADPTVLSDCTAAVLTGFAKGVRSPPPGPTLSPKTFPAT